MVELGRWARAKFAQSEKSSKLYSPALSVADNPNGMIPFWRSQNGVNTSMHRPARGVQWKALVRQPAARVVFVLLIGACLWTLTGRRERIVENSPVAARQSESTDTTAPRTRTPATPRQLPQRTLPPVAMDDRPVHADFETNGTGQEPAVHAAGFTAEVSANTPVWLTGKIEYE